MRIVAISDTHQKHRKIKIPDGDVFICAGDITEFNRSKQHYIDFNDWLGTLPHPYKLIIAGNHDELFQKNPEQARGYITNGTYLEDDEITIDGVKFYGSPWQKWFYDWAFNLPPGSNYLKEKWAAIPDDTDVLITHSPPFKILDTDISGESLGCELLTERIFEVQPKLHVFGHIHASCGRAGVIGNTLFFNVCHDYKSNIAYTIDLVDGKAFVVW
jgi:Icc-related predicted phosphoesterase